MPCVAMRCHVTVSTQHSAQERAAAMLAEKAPSFSYSFICFLAASYLIGRFGLSYLALALVAVSWVVEQRRRKHVAKAPPAWLASTSGDGKPLPKEAIETFLLAMPPWVNSPDIERAEWLNSVLASLWPKMKIAAEGSIRDSVSALLSSHKPSFLTSLELACVELGSHAPMVLGLKPLPANDCNVAMLNLELLWTSPTCIDVMVSLSSVFLAFQAPAHHTHDLETIEITCTFKNASCTTCFLNARFAMLCFFGF
eukprot:g70159.t1